MLPVNIWSAACTDTRFTVAWNILPSEHTRKQLASQIQCKLILQLRDYDTVSDCCVIVKGGRDTGYNTWFTVDYHKRRTTNYRSIIPSTIDHNTGNELRVGVRPIPGRRPDTRTLLNLADTIWWRIEVCLLTSQTGIRKLEHGNLLPLSPLSYYKHSRSLSLHQVIFGSM